MQPFSVLMSVYHRDKPEFLRLALKSIWNNQTVKPNEIVIVKDGVVGSALDAVIDEFTHVAPIVIVPLPVNGGLGKALNEGIKHCKNELVARMDADDISKSNRFEKQLEVFDKHPEYDVVGSWIDEFVDDKENVVSKRTLPEMPNELYKYSKSRCPVNHPTIIYKRSKVIEAGGYYGFPEDLYLWVRMMMAGCKFYNLQESLLWFRTSADLYKRRGGWKYCKDDIRAQISFYKIGFLSMTELVKNIAIRCGVRLMPNSARVFVYQKLLRK